MTLPLISASQITSYRDCARKWGWGYIARMRSPQTASQALGTEVDDEQLQPYLRDGRPFDFTRESGYIAASGLEYLPKPKTPGLEVQKHFVLPSPASNRQFAYQGYKDLWLPDSAAVPGLKGGVPFVGDFKTCKDFRWMKGESALRVDVQAMLYATNAMFETGASEVDLRWIYLRTKGARQARATDLRVGADEVIEQFKAIEATALEMFDARKRSTGVDTNQAVLALPPTPSHCDAYGGCPYQHLCNLSPTQKESAWGSDEMSRLANKGYVMGDTNSLLANLKAKKAGAQAATTEAPSGVVGSNPAGSAAPSPPAPLGINPPEKDLPPPEPKAATRKRSAPKDPVGADAHAATDKQLPLPYEAPKKPLSEQMYSAAETVRAVVMELQGIPVCVDVEDDARWAWKRLEEIAGRLLARERRS